jgi:hypothetical protein
LQPAGALNTVIGAILSPAAYDFDDPEPAACKPVNTPSKFTAVAFSDMSYHQAFWAVILTCSYDLELTRAKRLHGKQLRLMQENIPTDVASCTQHYAGTI